MRLLALFAFGTLVFAADVPLPTVSAEPAGDSGSVIRVRNTGSAALTAFVVEMVDYPGNRFGMAQDLIWEKPVPPGETAEYKTGAMMPGSAPEYLKARAAVYADGSTAGLPEKVAMLLDVRRRTLRGIRAVLARMGDRVDAVLLRADLRSWKDTVDGDTGLVAGIVIEQLKQASASEVRDDLREREKFLSGSKPALESP